MDPRQAPFSELYCDWSVIVPNVSVQKSQFLSLAELELWLVDGALSLINSDGRL